MIFWNINWAIEKLKNSRDHDNFFASENFSHFNAFGLD